MWFPTSCILNGQLCEMEGDARRGFLLATEQAQQEESSAPELDPSLPSSLLPPPSPPPKALYVARTAVASSVVLQAVWGRFVHPGALHLVFGKVSSACQPPLTRYGCLVAQPSMRCAQACEVL